MARRRRYRPSLSPSSSSSSTSQSSHHHHYYYYQYDEQRSQIPGTNVGPDPMWTTCPNCDEEILTTTEASVSIFQMLVSGCLCFFCYCCWWFPFCMHDWKDVLHTCPNCNYAIGKYKKMWWNQKTNHQKKPLISINLFQYNKIHEEIIFIFNR